MKILEISNNNGWYLLNDIKKSISDLNKEDIFCLLEIIYLNDEIEMDNIDEEHIILNEAEKIIYDNMYKYIVEFEQKKADISKEIEEEFKDVIKLFESNQTE